MKTTVILLTLLLTSCAGLNDYAKYPIYRNHEKPKELTVIEKLDTCTEKYISRLGVNADKAYEICNSIYRR